MAWTATVGPYVKGGGVASIPVDLTDGTEIIRKVYNATSLQNLKDQVRSTIDQITSVYNTYGALPAPGTVLDYSAATTAPPVSTSGSYAASALAMAKSASKNYISIFNADPSLIVDVVGIKIAQEVSAAVVGFVRGYRAFRLTAVHTLGSPITPEKLDTASANLSANITVRSNGQTAAPSAVAVGIAALNEDETAGGNDTWLYLPDAAPSIVLRQNQGIVVQQDAQAGIGSISAIIYFNVR